MSRTAMRLLVPAVLAGAVITGAAAPALAHTAPAASRSPRVPGDSPLVDAGLSLDLNAAALDLEVKGIVAASVSGAVDDNAAGQAQAVPSPKLENSKLRVRVGLVGRIVVSADIR